MFVQSVGYLLFSTSSMFPFIRFLSTLLFYCLLRPNGRIFLLRLTRQTLDKQMRRRCDEVRPADWADSLENYYRRINQILMSRRNAIYLHLFILLTEFCQQIFVLFMIRGNKKQRTEQFVLLLCSCQSVFKQTTNSKNLFTDNKQDFCFLFCTDFVRTK